MLDVALRSRPGMGSYESQGNKEPQAQELGLGHDKGGLQACKRAQVFFVPLNSFTQGIEKLLGDFPCT